MFFSGPIRCSSSRCYRSSTPLRFTRMISSTSTPTTTAQFTHHHIRTITPSSIWRTKRSPSPSPCSIEFNRLQKPRYASTSFSPFSPSPPLSSTSSSSSAPGQPDSESDPTARIRASMRRKNNSTMNYTLSILIGTLALAYGSVPFYKMICQTTGWGGQPIRSPSHGGAGTSGSDPSIPETEEETILRLSPATDMPRIRVTFRSSVSEILPWKFVPQQRDVYIHPGETALAFYTATNNSPENEDIIGVATYSVSPGQAAPYFSKIQCFCFEEQRLLAGETVDMPVFFYIDKDIAFDRNCKNIKEITLNYTFFKAKYDRDGHLNPVPMPTFASSFKLGQAAKTDGAPLPALPALPPPSPEQES